MRRSIDQDAPCGGYHSHVLLLSDRFRYPRRRLLFGRARFFGDRIELSGWTLRGRHRRCIPLGQVASMEYHPLENDANLSLYLDEGEEVRLHVEQAHRWRACFESWLRYDVLPTARLMQKIEQVAALAG